MYQDKANSSLGGASLMGPNEQFLIKIHNCMVKYKLVDTTNIHQKQIQYSAKEELEKFWQLFFKIVMKLFQ